MTSFPFLTNNIAGGVFSEPHFPKAEDSEGVGSLGKEPLMFLHSQVTCHAHIPYSRLLSL